MADDDLDTTGHMGRQPRPSQGHTPRAVRPTPIPGPRRAMDAVACYLPRDHRADPVKVPPAGDSERDVRHYAPARRAGRHVRDAKPGPISTGHDDGGHPGNVADGKALPEAVGDQRRPAIYVRVSGAPGRKPLDEAIEAAREAACLARGAAAPPYVFVDFGHAVIRRPALARLFALVRSGAVDIVAVARVSDLTRDAIALGMILREIGQAGAVLVAPGIGRISTSNAMMSGYLVRAQRSPRRTAGTRPRS